MGMAGRMCLFLQNNYTSHHFLVSHTPHSLITSCLLRLPTERWAMAGGCQTNGHLIRHISLTGLQDRFLSKVSLGSRPESVTSVPPTVTAGEDDFTPASPMINPAKTGRLLEGRQ